MKNKLLCFDVDGTLRDNVYHKVSPSTMEALKRLKKNGYKIVISSGRGVDSLKRTGLMEMIDWNGYTQYMVLAWSVFTMAAMFFFGKYLTYLFVSPSETDVIEVAVTYFHTVFWAYPFLGSIFIYRNALQGMEIGRAHV